MPDDAVMVATDGIALLHTPPGVVFVRFVVWPWHTIPVPDMAAGNALTVTVAVRIQPASDVPVMIVVPGKLPVTTPVPASIVATAVVLLLQLTPAVALPKAVVAPWHTCGLPVMAAGNAFTVTPAVAIQPVGNE
jgi:hypothetical protein